PPRSAPEASIRHRRAWIRLPTGRAGRPWNSTWVAGPRGVCWTAWVWGLVVRLSEQFRGVDADQLGVGLDPAVVDADAVFAIVGIGVHGGPEVGELQAEDHIGIAHHRRRTAEIMGLGEIHAAALIDHLRL